MKKENLFLILSFIFLIFLALFYNLGERPLFGVEGRWAEGAREMTLRNSWFVPTINFEPHITKPLIPFWLIKISGELLGYSEFSVRLPGVLLGLFSILLFYFLALKLFEKKEAFIATSLYTSSLGFIQFVRLAQSEIYQLFGIVLALTIYVYFYEQKSFLGYILFILALLFGALSKGLSAIAVLTIFVFIDLFINKRFYHLNFKLFISIVIGILIYFLPYYLTSKELNTHLVFYQWFKENIKQATNPYDNLRPFYIYFYYWPIWIVPFSLFLFGALFNFLKHFKKLTPIEKVLLLSNIAIFLLFTLVKARRGYYILPILPFSILLITFYLKNFSQNIFLRIYQILVYFIPFLTLSSIFILKKLKFSLSFETIFIIFLFFLFQNIILFFRSKFSYTIFYIILLFFSVEVLCFAYYQPKFSKSTEKLAGRFVEKLKNINSHLVICTFSIEKEPVANFYFYADIDKKIPKYEDFNTALKECEVIILRKNILDTFIEKAKEKAFNLQTFEDNEDKSKNYYIFYSSSILKTSRKILL